MAKHEKGDPACPDMHYWWDDTWSRHNVRRDRERAAAAAQAAAALITAKGFEHVRVLPVNIESRDGFFAVKYSTYQTYTPAFHTCRCPETEGEPS